MSKIFVTSDLHFNHDQPFIWEERGFSSVKEMNETYVQRWNETINDEDEIYVLGDLMLNDNESGINYLKQLKGNIHIILGNHDTQTREKLYTELPNVVEITLAKRLKYKKYHFILSHYPMLASNFDKNEPLKVRTISLCGHNHTPNKFEDMDKGLIYHCEVDAHDGYPVLIDNIIEDLKNWKENRKITIDFNKLIKNAFNSYKCDKCVYTYGLCGEKDFKNCSKFKKDPPDGGYYG